MENLFFFQRGNKIASVWFLWHFKVCWLFPQLWRLTEQRKILQLLCKDASLFFFFFLHTDYLLSVCASVKMWQMKYRKFSHSGQHGLYSPQGWTRLVLSNSSYFYSICVEVLLLLFCCEWKLKTSFITVEDLCANPAIHTNYIPYAPDVSWHPSTGSVEVKQRRNKIFSEI